MLGRGVIANPGLVREIRTGEKITKEELHLYHDKLYEGYLADLQAEKDVLYKMKEMWFYLGTSFTNSEKALKTIQKAKQPMEYKTAVKALWPLLEVK
jgi:tRNA-dihydrouridine synthase